MEEKPLVLVVDDVPENIDVLAGVLRNDYQIRAAINGAIALKLAQKMPQPDIILLDIMMPGIDGFEVCRLLKSELSTQHIPIIFVTAKMAQEDELLGFELGAVDYITKPISPARVKQRIKTHLALSRQNIELDRKVHEQLQVIEATRTQIIMHLGRAAEYKDNETGMHVVRMSKFSYLIAKAYGLTEPHCQMILNASPMHDVGKIGIPDAILKKPGPLDEYEWEVMKSHAQIGAEILGDSPDSDLLKLAKIVAISHHEKWDGSGYPNGLKAEQIPIEGRLVAIADVFDALTSERPYKKAWGIDDAVTMIKNNAGTHFDPSLVAAFTQVLPSIIEVKSNHQD